MLSIALFVSCSPRALHEAQDVVSQADSLWQQGEMYRDSVSLAQAYSTLGNWKWFYADEYVHSCYHYGKLLRAKDDPVSAMQVFINATHTPTHDYHILGRVYSNMGDIAHLASAFKLSFDMFEKSADRFLKDADTLSYYYCLNSMAFQLVEQGEGEEALPLLDEIEKICADDQLKARTEETRAKWYLQIGQCDSVIYSINRSSYINATRVVYKARAFEYLGKIDSALYYAGEVLAMPSSSVQDRYNMLYIIVHYDSLKSKEQLIELTSERADMGIAIDDLHSKHAQATEILRHDVSQKPYQRPIIIFVVLIIVAIGLIIALCIYYTHKKKSLYNKTKQALQVHSKLREQQNLLYETRLEQVQMRCSALQQSDDILSDLRWKDYEQFCEFINHEFFLLIDKLKASGISGTKELQLCVLVFIGGFKNNQMADMLYYSHKSIRSTKRHIAIKLGTTSANLHSFLVEMAIK